MHVFSDVLCVGYFLLSSVLSACNANSLLSLCHVPWTLQRLIEKRRDVVRRVTSSKSDKDHLYVAV